MALFADNRDMSLFRNLNREMIERLIDTIVYYYERIADVETNVYGEAVGDAGLYYQPLKIPAVVEIDLSQWQNEIGIQDQKRQGSFFFLRDYLKDVITNGMYPQVGDVVEWEGHFWEIDAVVDDDQIAGKGEYWEGGETHGQLWGITCQVHKMRRELSKIVPRP